MELYGLSHILTNPEHIYTSLVVNKHLMDKQASMDNGISVVL